MRANPVGFGLEGSLCCRTDKPYLHSRTVQGEGPRVVSSVLIFCKGTSSVFPAIISYMCDPSPYMLHLAFS
jgi:hypothetical protein